MGRVALIASLAGLIAFATLIYLLVRPRVPPPGTLLPVKAGIPASSIPLTETLTRVAILGLDGAELNSAS